MHLARALAQMDPFSCNSSSRRYTVFLCVWAFVQCKRFLVNYSLFIAITSDLVIVNEIYFSTEDENMRCISASLHANVQFHKSHTPKSKTTIRFDQLLERERTLEHCCSDLLQFHCEYIYKNENERKTPKMKKKRKRKNNREFWTCFIYYKSQFCNELECKRIA